MAKPNVTTIQEGHDFISGYQPVGDDDPKDESVGVIELAENLSSTSRSVLSQLRKLKDLFGNPLKHPEGSLRYDADVQLAQRQLNELRGKFAQLLADSTAAGQAIGAFQADQGDGSLEDRLMVDFDETPVSSNL